MCPGRDGEERKNAGKESAGGGRGRTRDEAVRWTCWVPGPSDDLKKNQFLMKPQHGQLQTVSLEVTKFWSPPRSPHDPTMLPRSTLAPMLHGESAGETQALPSGTLIQHCSG